MNAQLDNHPVSLARPQPSSTPPRLPPIAHVLAPSRQDQVPAPTEVLIALARDRPAVQDVGEVDCFARWLCRRRRRDNVAVGAEAAETAIRVHGELEMGDG
jgi:hypothetical protein